MKYKKHLFHFKGIKEELETKEERKNRLQMQFKKDYNAYMKRREHIINRVVADEIKEFINRPCD